MQIYALVFLAKVINLWLTCRIKIYENKIIFINQFFLFIIFQFQSYGFIQRKYIFFSISWKLHLSCVGIFDQYPVLHFSSWPHSRRVFVWTFSATIIFFVIKSWNCVIFEWNMGNSVSAAESVAAHVTGNLPKAHPTVHGAGEPPPECPMHKKADAAPKAQVYNFT